MLPLDASGRLLNFPRFLWEPRLLSAGACDGGTPKAFMRRRLLRAAARRAEKLERRREANRASPRVSDEKVDVCLSKTTEVSNINRGAQEGNMARTSEEATCSWTGPTDEALMDLFTTDGRRATARLTASATSLPVRAQRQSAQNGSDSGQQPISGAARTMKGPAKVGSEHREYAGGRSTIGTPDVGTDGDVRKYVQGFRGFSSAYGGYSSIFGSQVKCP